MHQDHKKTEEEDEVIPVNLRIPGNSFLEKNSVIEVELHVLATTDSSKLTMMAKLWGCEREKWKKELNDID